MKKLCFLLFAIAAHYFCNGQITSGNYGDYGSLDLAFDKQTQRVTGEYQFYSGFDLETGVPRFTCVFYIDGKVINKKAAIKIYAPFGNSIEGELIVVNDKEVTIKIPEKYEACWNAEYLSKPVQFTLEKSENWIAAKYVVSDKLFFHSMPNENGKTKAYLVKGNTIFIDTIDKDWVHCTYFGKKKNTIGWIKAEFLNP